MRFWLIGMLFVAGCAGTQPAPSPEVASIIEKAKTDRDAGKITWSQWVERTDGALRQTGLNTPEGELILAKRRVIAERVDAKRMTPAEGTLAIISIANEYQQRQAMVNEARRAAIARALSEVGNGLTQIAASPARQPSRPTTTICRPEFGQVRCTTE